MVLKWFKDDAMYAREVYSYDLFEKFGVWTAPQSSYCKLTIKVTGDSKAAYFGVYQLQEPVDDVYLANRSTFFFLRLEIYGKRIGEQVLKMLPLRIWELKM